MNKLRVILLCAVCILVSPVIFAQDDYVVGERDELLILVQGQEEMTQTVTVSAEGTITYWYLGEVPVNGMSILQITNYLTNVLSKDFLRNPVVQVQVAKYRSKEVQIQGAVAKPGAYILETNSVTLLKLISMAGGCGENRGPVAYIIRGSEVEKLKHEAEVKEIESIQEEIKAIESRIEVDLDVLLVQGDPSEDRTIYGGDYVLISPIGSIGTGNLIWIEGKIEKPGSMPYRSGLTALQACLQAGGFTDTAAPNRATITRQISKDQSETIKVRLKDISRNKRQDVPLQPGDRITIPESVF